MTEKMPPEVAPAVLTVWYKNDGEYVKVGDVLCEFESDKATFELAADYEGILDRFAQVGDELQIGDVICEIK